MSITIARALERLGVRARMYALRVETVNDLERQRDDARESRDRLIDRVATVITERDELKRTCDRAREMADGVRAELRASGYPDLAEGHLAVDLGRAVDIAIDRERSKGQDFLEELAAALEAPPCHRTQSTHVWPTDARELLKLAGRRTNAEQRDRHTSVKVKVKRGEHTPEFTGEAPTDGQPLVPADPDLSLLLDEHDVALELLGQIISKLYFVNSRQGFEMRKPVPYEVGQQWRNQLDELRQCRELADRAPSRHRGRVVDGDLLTKAIRASLPKYRSDAFEQQLIDGVLDQAVTLGLTVLHGATGEQSPRMSREQRETVPF